MDASEADTTADFGRNDDKRDEEPGGGASRMAENAHVVQERAI